MALPIKMHLSIKHRIGKESMTDQQKDHEILDVFKAKLHPLSTELTEMLNEHYTHQTERRGCGYTQATRVMADYVNVARHPQEFTDFKLFDAFDTKAFKYIVNHGSDSPLKLETWRNLDLHPAVIEYLKQEKDDALSAALKEIVAFQKGLRSIYEATDLEESKIICQFIEDSILPKDAQQENLTVLNTLNERPKVGSCPMAEKFFLKVAHDQFPRQGVLNIFVDEHNQPVMLEKLNMGDNHSCVSLVPLMMNGIRLPAGSLFAIEYDPETVQKTTNKQHKGDIIPINQVSFWFLRITTLAISPKNRARAFSMHFKQQVQNGLLNPEITELSQLISIAKKQF